MECFIASDSVGVARNIWDGGHPLDFSFPLLSIQVSVIISVTWGLHFLLKPLKQPRIVSEILGGILLGPSGIGRNQTFRETVFPKRGKPVMDTVSSFGLMFVIFVIGVKMDAGLLKRSGTKSIVIGILGFLVPFSFILSYCLLSHSLPKMDDKAAASFAFATSLSITSFAVLVPILSDLSLLNSELGQIAMSASMTNDSIGWVFMTTYIVVQAANVSPAKSVSAFFSVAFLVVVIVWVVRPAAIWVIENTPPGQRVSEGYIFVFLIIVMMIGFYGDVVGTNSFHGALLLGLAIPEGPPLGATLAEKMEGMVNGMLLPLFYVLLGLNTDVTAIVDDWHWLAAIMMLGMTGKLVGVLLPSLYYGIPIRDAVSLSLYMNAKGIVEVVTFNLWRTNKLINEQTYSVLMISSVAVTAVMTPLATILYEPSRRYTVYKRRTIEHHRQGNELRILACVHDEARVPGIINLLEAAQGPTGSPLAVYALHLIELIGRAAPVLIPHSKRTDDSLHQEQQALAATIPNLASAGESEHIANAFLHFEKRHRTHVSVHPFTTISPYTSMHDEICRLAVEKRTSLIVLPFHRGLTAGGFTEVNAGLRTVNRKVLASAPCSVGVLIDASSGGGPLNSGEFAHDIVVFFFGGADDREALALGALMVSHSGVALTVVRFLPSRSIRDDQTERKLDQRSIEEFRMSSRRSDRVTYREALVRDMEEIVGVIMEENGYDLVIVGMRHRSNSVVSEQLSEWTQCPELGVIGDLLASSDDFDARFSVLVVKQQDDMGLHQPHHHASGAGNADVDKVRSGVGSSGPLAPGGK